MDATDEARARVWRVQPASDRKLAVSGVDSARVNPELGLTIKGGPHLIKLYFKAEALTKNRIDIITHLMAGPAASRLLPPVLWVCSTSATEAFHSDVPIDGFDTMLRAEAAYWITAWHDLA